MTVLKCTALIPKMYPSATFSLTVYYRSEPLLVFQEFTVDSYGGHEVLINIEVYCKMALYIECFHGGLVLMGSLRSILSILPCSSSTSFSLLLARLYGTTIFLIVIKNQTSLETEKNFNFEVYYNDKRD